MTFHTLQGSSTLLVLRLSLCPTDADAWDAFVRRYGGTIYGWCRSHHLQDTDARDVTQNVFTFLLTQLGQFDRSRAPFRAWLYQVVTSRVRDWCKGRAQRQEKGTEEAWRILESAEARRDLETRLNEEFDLELLEIAEARVRLQVQPSSWDAYRYFCKEGLTLREAGEQVGIPAGHVSKYAGRVRDMVAREVAGLESQSAPGGDREKEGRYEHLSSGGRLPGLPGGPAERG
jgi:RNA polymerase sigma-70 factor (ECF subfamily)